MTANLDKKDENEKRAGKNDSKWNISKRVSCFIDDDQTANNDNDDDDNDKKISNNKRQKHRSTTSRSSSSNESDNENHVGSTKNLDCPPAKHICVDIPERSKLLDNKNTTDKKRDFNRDVVKKQSSIYRFYQSAKIKGTRSIDTLISEDSIYLVTLGVLMGIFSFAIDFCIACLRQLHLDLSRRAEEIDIKLQYAVWVSYTMALVLMSAAICQFMAPQAVGSGIPEMKTILRGVVLKEYLTLRTLIAKFLGLILALGTGLPIGKEGPFVHIASMLARLLSSCANTFKGIFENESRHSEMLAAACAVGVASTYGAPIGGVLFSIEVTSVFFPLRNYWRGFLSTVCSAITFRLLAVWFDQESKNSLLVCLIGTVKPFSATTFPYDYPFDPKELFVFALIGLFCGFGGALFVWLHRKYVSMFLQNPFLKRTLFKCWLTYPVLLVFILASIKCPLGYGHYFAGGLSPRDALSHLFSNFSWLDANATNAQTNESQAIFQYWADGRNIFATLSLYSFNMFWMTAVAITLPIPCGVFIPVFVSGAAFGRVIGETMALLFPEGVRSDGIVSKIIPGAYAIVGATALSGAVTHAISTSVVVVEITGQILYILPTMLAVLIANAVCAKLQPSIYDSIIKLKKLPYIPAISNMSSGIHRIYVHDLMVTDVKYITLESTYSELQDLLMDYPRLKTFPLVDRHSSLILLGSISRSQLLHVMNDQLGDEARKVEALRRAKIRENLQDLQRVVLMKTASGKNLRSGGQEGSNDAEGGRKNSRFTIRKVSSHEIITENAAQALKKRRDTISHEAEDVSMEPANESSTSTYHKVMTTVRGFGNYMNTLPLKFRESLRRHGMSHPGLLPEPDLIDDEKIEWEAERLGEQMKFENLQIDPAPFQLVERTSLYRVHALFWMLGLNRAYVTSLGRLVGVVALRELRTALEKAQPTINCSTEKLAPPKRKQSTIQPPKNIKTLEKQILNAKKSHEGALSGNDHEKKRLFSINPSMCLVPAQSEALSVPLKSPQQS